MKTDIKDLLLKLEILNETYLWSISEAKKILNETENLIKSDNPRKFIKINKLRDKFMELQNRHMADKALYNKLINESRAFIKKKYNTDIIKFLEGEE